MSPVESNDLDEAFERCPEPLCVVSADGELLRVNDAWAETTGHAPAELRGRALRDLVHPEDRGAVGRPRFECRFATAHGGWRWLAWSTTPLEGGARYAAVRDVHDHKQAERRLTTQFAVARVLAEAESLAEAMPRLLEAICRAESWQAGGLWWIDGAAGTARCHAMWHDPALDFDELEATSMQMELAPGVGLPGRVWAQRGPICSVDLTEDPRLRRGAAAIAGLRCACGFPIWRGEELVGVLEFFADELRRPDALMFEMMRHVGGQLGQFADRVRAEEALRRAEERLEYVIAHAPLVLFAVDRGGVVILYDGKALEAVGTRRGELLGASVFERYPASHPIHRNIRRALAGEAFTDVVTLAERGLSFETRYAPTRGSRGEVTGVIGVATDITERVRAEEAVRHLEAQRLDADRMAALGTLSAGVAHEINNPLTYIRLNVGRLVSLEMSRKPQTPLQLHRLEMLQEIREGVARIERIVRDLRAFARPDPAGNGPTDLRRVLDSAINLVTHEIRHRARLRLDLPELPPVRGDAGRLGQLFLNLLVNAAQSIPEGEAHLNEIRISAHRAEPDRVVVEVTDSGTGIPPDVLGRIFDPFFTTRPGLGAGLGLSVCRGLARSLGGDIEVDSALGRGTTFRVGLPAHGQVVRPSAPVEPSEPRQLDGARLLVIDDERTIAVTLAAILGELHEVRVAGSGREAFEILRRDDDFDAILCDLIMPEVSGMDMYEALRLVQPGLAERIIFMTSGAFTPRAERFLAEVPNPRIEKPFDIAALQDLIQSRLTRRRAPRAGPAAVEQPHHPR